MVEPGGRRGAGHPFVPGPMALLLVLACGPGEHPREAHLQALTGAGEGVVAAGDWEPHLRGAGEDPDALREPVALLRRGTQARARGDLAEAEGFYRAAGEGSPALSDWAALLAAGALAEGGNPAGVEDALTGLPTDLADLRAWGPRVRALEVAGRADEAIDMARQALARAPDPESRRGVAVALGKLALGTGDTATAREVFTGVLEEGNTDPASRAAAEALEGRVHLDGPAYRALISFHLRQGRVERAGGILDAMRRHPGLPEREVRRASLDHLAARVAGGGGEASLGALLSLARLAPEADIRSGAWLAAGRAHLRQGRGEGAVPFLERAVEAQPDGPAVQEALLLLGDLDQDAGRFASARDRFALAVASDPRSEWGAEAAVRLGAILYQEGDRLRAAAVFEAMRDAHPEGWRYQQGTFWAGMAYLRQGEHETARDRFADAQLPDPLGYYGMRARLAGGGAPELPEVWAGPAPSEGDALLARGGIARVEALRQAGLEEAAATEERRLRNRMATLPGGLHALAEAYLERGRLVEGVRVGREARRRQGRWDARLLRIVFPLPYQEEIREQAGRWGLDPYLVAALVRQESLFQPHAVSPAGAVGLMQVHPRTARHLSGRAGLGSVRPAHLRDPGVNLLLGTLFLGDLVRRSRERLDDALVAYNAGSGRLARWRGFPEYSDPDLFLERIPFRETREYVRTVQESIPIYAFLYGAHTGQGPGDPGEGRGGLGPGAGSPP